MHTLLGLSSVLLVLLGGHLALNLVRGLRDWSQRRDGHLLVLAAPVVSLAIGVAGVHHFAGRVCFVGAPAWDLTLGTALPLGMGLVALGGLGLGGSRLALMHRFVARSGGPPGRELRALVEHLAERLGVRRPRVLVCAVDRPLAFTYGLFRPTLLLSTWMVEHLDRREVESVLAHELAHVARRDYPISWLATVLRDAFFYLPTSRAAHRELHHDKELACDDLAAHVTSRPLALASALAKVWQRALAEPALETAQPLLGTGEMIEERIERLLAGPQAGRDVWRTTDARRRERREKGPRSAALGVGVVALGALLVVEIANTAVMLAPMGCGPVSSLAGLL
ncbi:MAG: M56 family metallopeptidase [Chloroflexi bacterium]|nr:M56 family metallopeptidase [Chloroflexota bacterium]